MPRCWILNITSNHSTTSTINKAGEFRMLMIFADRKPSDDQHMIQLVFAVWFWWFNFTQQAPPPRQLY